MLWYSGMKPFTREVERVDEDGYWVYQPDYPYINVVKKEDARIINGT